ncbi:MAG: putative tail length tape measure protein [Prokaryotic dsDNA virus sp.]|nr:MAG: putative tail length tape measure protein [Prokaryotic dsDNA virus sp.]|tara:strand:- start:292 stop:2223 length:1932 start_codon:yes stop_codon:yes gene_type:complete
MEKVIDVKVNIEQAKKNFDDVNESIKLQEKFVSDLRLKIAELEFEMSNMNGTQQMMADQTLKKFNAELKVEAASLRALKVEASQYNKVLKTQNKTTGVGKVRTLEFNESLLKNRDIQTGLNTITGGLSGRISGLSRLFISTSKGIRTAAISLNVFKKALIATGIGALVVLVATLAANWDKVVEALNGVSREQKNQLEDLKELVAAEKERFQDITATEESLKRSGKSEREILNLKIQQTNETITALEAQLETQREIKKAQVETSQRNKEILQGVLTFISAPLSALLIIVDGIGEAFGKDFGLREGLFGGIAELVFDPEEVAEEGDKAIQETEKQLQELKNRRDGFLNKIDKEDKEKADKKKAETDKANQEALDDEEKRLQAITDLQARYRKLNQDAEDISFEEKALRQKERALAELEQLNATEEQKAQAILYFDNLIKEAKIKDAQAITNAIEQQEAARTALKLQALDSAISIANEETAVGRALIVAKQILLAKEAIINFKKNLINATSAMTGVTLTASEASVQTTASIAKAANVAPPPLNLPFIATALATAASVISAVKGAVDATKSAASAAGAGGSTSARLDTPSIQTQAPAFNIVGASPENQLAQTIAGQTQQPIQAYVVANDVTTAQGLERNIIQESSLG